MLPPPLEPRARSLTVILTHISAAILSLAALATFAAAPSFQTVRIPDGWSVIKGEIEPGLMRSKTTRSPLQVRTAEAQSLPLEAVIKFRATVGDSISVQFQPEDPAQKPLIQFTFRPMEAEYGSITCSADGEPLPLACHYTAVWRTSLQYGWRYPRVKNLWDDPIRKEIGAAYATLAPFSERTFVLRFILGKTGREIWLDDRFVAEVPHPNPNKAHLDITLTKDAQVTSVAFLPFSQKSRYLPLGLDDHSHKKRASTNDPSRSESRSIHGIPFMVPTHDEVALKLSESLYRYRQTKGSGPNVPYVDAGASWPSAFDVDPASLALRVPYRAYQTAWLLASVDDAPNTVPRGEIRFYRQSAGYPASSPFEISEQAIRNGNVRPSGLKTPTGNDIFLVRVPLNTAGLYGLRDAQGRFLDLELCKPTALGRSYPDPIYYGEHPAGLPSSLRILGITLDEASFDFSVTPSSTAFVYERPENPDIKVRVHASRPEAKEAKITALTESFDGQEKHRVTKLLKISPGQHSEIDLTLPCTRSGWHDLQLRVEVAGEERTAPLSLVILPPNTRTYGNAANETRFGIWQLLGHYVPPTSASPLEQPASADRHFAMYRRLGMRRASPVRVGPPQPKADPLVIKEEGLRLLEKYDFLPVGPHTIAGNAFGPEPEQRTKALDRELSNVVDAKRFPGTTYFYGGEWGISRDIQHAPWPRYTGDGDRAFTPQEETNLDRHISIFSDIGRVIRKASPNTKLVLQWGAVNGTFAYARKGFPKELVDMYGMDAPHFELMPEISNVTGSINEIWQFRQEMKRLGWPELPINWTEGPFFPTNPGALTEKEQAEYQIRYWLLAIAYGVEVFESGVVPFDAGNYYGAEHYGAGVFRRTPLECPKPAVAAIATATSMLCGADLTGPIETGSLTTYGLAFSRKRDNAKIHALWRASGSGTVQIKIPGGSAKVTDAMGIERIIAAKDGTIELDLTSSPVWVTDAGAISAIRRTIDPRTSKASAPSAPHRPLAAMTAALWNYDGTPVKAYENNHFGIRRITDPALRIEFAQGEEGFADALAVTLQETSSDRPLANRYGSLVLKKPVVIPGKASALGIHIKGNNSWGRVVYQLRDAKGEIWTSNGTKDDWNCDDTHGWSYVHFDGWRYVRFPLPSSHPYDAARGLETTWWGSSGGDGIVDLPLTLDRIFVEARNEVPWLGQMRTVPDRSYKLSQLVVEYAQDADAEPATLIQSRLRAPVPAWAGPASNLIAKLRSEGTDAIPNTPTFTEPDHFNDGRSMIVHFEETAGATYQLYLSLNADGRGAELHAKAVKNGGTVRGLRPEVPMYLFLTSIGPDKRESKPSAPQKLVTHDNFAEK